MDARQVYRNPPFIGLVLGLLFWALDAVVDVYLFGETESLWQSLWSPRPAEIWMRSVVLVLLMLFGCYARFSLRRLRQSYRWMEEYREELEKEIQMRRETERALHKLAIFDPLTGVYNRRYLDQTLQYEVERSRRYETDLSVLFCDLDHFKEINDNYGHGEGDRVLRAFADRVAGNIRCVDRLARWGGEEFVVLAPGLDAEGARCLAEKLRGDAENYSWSHWHGMTVSIGVAQYRLGESEADFINRADAALYRSKRSGRNRVTVA